jgi:hypothetical protein
MMLASSSALTNFAPSGDQRVHESGDPEGSAKSINLLYRDIASTHHGDGFSALLGIRQETGIAGGRGGLHKNLSVFQQEERCRDDVLFTDQDDVFDVMTHDRIVQVFRNPRGESIGDGFNT